MENLPKIIIVLSLIILLALIIRYLQNNNIELFTNNISEVDKKKYLTNISEEHIEFILLNVKLGIKKYLTVIHHQPFNYQNKQYLPIGQFSIITNEEIPQKSNFFTNAIRENESAHLCSSINSVPSDYQEIWNSNMMYEPTSTPFSIWRPIPKPGFISLSDVIVRGMQKPNTNFITCVPIEHTVQLNNSNSLIWSDNGIECISIGRSFKRCINDTRNFIKYDLNNDINGLITDNENSIFVSAKSSGN
jgi:hypothetical protein